MQSQDTSNGLPVIQHHFLKCCTNIVAIRHWVACYRFFFFFFNIGPITYVLLLSPFYISKMKNVSLKRLIALLVSQSRKLEFELRLPTPQLITTVLYDLPNPNILLWNEIWGPRGQLKVKEGEQWKKQKENKACWDSTTWPSFFLLMIVYGMVATVPHRSIYTGRSHLINELRPIVHMSVTWNLAQFCNLNNIVKGWAFTG